MSKTATVTLIIGNVGAGKSTHAARLARETNAHVFNVDEWMKTLYMADHPPEPDFAWALERTERVEAQILKETDRLLDRGANVILDLGFFSTDQRTRVRNHFLAQGRVAILHMLNVDRETRWARVDKRNREETETFQFEVSREIFDFCETIFERLDDEERRAAVPIES